MPAPSGALSTLRPDLGGSLEEFDLDMNAQKYVGYEVMPILETGDAAGTFGRIPVEELLKTADVRRNARGGYNRSNFNFTEDSFATKEYGIEVPLDHNQAKMYRNYFDAELATSRLSRHLLKQAAEIRVADAVFNATTFSSYLTGVSVEWSTHATATPIANVHAARLRFYLRTGLWPNAIIFNQIVRNNLAQCDEITDRIASLGAGNRSQPNDITNQKLAELFELEKVIVAGGTKNTAKEGQTAAFAPIWSSEYAMLTRIATSSDISEPCLGRTMHWDADGSQPGGMVETYDSPEVRGTVYRNRHQVHEKILYTEMGELLGNITA